MSQQTLMNAILSAEKYLKNLSPTSEVALSITAESKGQLWDVFHEPKFKGIRLYKPGEHSFEQQYYFFRYSLPERPNIIITVKTKPIITKLNP